MKFFILFSLSLLFLVPAFSAADDYLNMAVLFKASGEIEKGIEVLTKVKDDFNQHPRFKAYLAKLKYLNGDSQAARNIFNSLKSKNWSSLAYLGLAYEDLGQINKAINSYLDSLQVKQNSLALFRLGKIYRNQSHYQKAVKYFTRLIKLDSSIRLAYYYLGDCLLKQNQYKPAYGFLSKAVNFYPESDQIALLFEEAKIQLGKDFFAAKKKLKDKERKKVKLTSYLPQEGILDISIGLAKELRQFSFSSGAPFIISDKNNTFKGEANILYTVIVDADRLTLQGYQDKRQYAVFMNSVKLSSLTDAKQKYPFYLLDLTYGKGNFWHKTVDRAYRGNIEAIAKKGTLTLINRLSIEEYLYGVLSAEIPHTVDQEALKAQAVAARTMVFRKHGRHRGDGFDFCADVHCQVYQGMSAEAASTTKAVDATRGQILKFNGKVIESFYHSNCGGCLASDVFGSQGYLVNKIDFKVGSLPRSAYEVEKWFIDPPDTFCSKDSGSTYRWQRIYDREDFLIAFGFKLEELKSFMAREIGECFHYKKVDIITTKGTKALRGDLAIRNYFDKLRSSAFNLEIKLSGDKLSKMLILWGAGFGHGTGLCQEGAMAMAKQGYNYKQILEHYYPNTDIEKAY